MVALPQYYTGNELLAIYCRCRATLIYMPEWTFLTNHARAMVFIARNPEARLRDIAVALDVAERTAYAIVSDLTRAGYVIKERDGRRNHYHIQEHLPVPAELSHRTIGEVLELFVAPTPDRTGPG